MYVVWGGQGRAATRIEYSRNINKKWNVSFNYRPILTDKQVLRNGRADGMLSVTTMISIHTTQPRTIDTKLLQPISGSGIM